MAVYLYRFTDEQKLYNFLAALNVSGLEPQLACTTEDGTAFLAYLKDPDADRVHHTRLDGDREHCCECLNHSVWTCTFLGSWAVGYPVHAVVPELPSVEAAIENGIEGWWQSSCGTGLNI